MTTRHPQRHLATVVVAPVAAATVVAAPAAADMVALPAPAQVDTEVALPALED